MWRIKRRDDVRLVVLTLSGRLEGERLSELRKAISCEADIHELVLDLKDLRLVDQAAVTFLADCEAEGASLRNCPRYARKWISAGLDKKLSPILE